MATYVTQRRPIFGANAGEMPASIELEAAVVAAINEISATGATAENARPLRKLWRLYTASCGESWEVPEGSGVGRPPRPGRRGVRRTCRRI